MTCYFKRKMHHLIISVIRLEKSWCNFSQLAFSVALKFDKHAETCLGFSAKHYKLFPQQIIWKTCSHLIWLWMLNNAGVTLCEVKAKEETGEMEVQRCTARSEMSCQESCQDSCTLLEDVQPWDASEKHLMLGCLWPRRRKHRWAQREDHCLDWRNDSFIFTKQRKRSHFQKASLVPNLHSKTNH